MSFWSHLKLLLAAQPPEPPQPKKITIEKAWKTEDERIALYQAEQEAVYRERIDRASHFIESLGVSFKFAQNLEGNPGTIRLGEYDPNTDLIGLLHKHRFSHLTEYYNVAFHEIAHWAQGKLGKDFDEEVAQAGADILSHHFGFTNERTENAEAQAIVDWLLSPGNRG